MTFQLTDDRAIFLLRGPFGCTGTPACFDVLSRVLRFELPHLVRRRASMYVDDIMSVCLTLWFNENVNRAVRFCQGLLGP